MPRRRRSSYGRPFPHERAPVTDTTARITLTFVALGALGAAAEGSTS